MKLEDQIEKLGELGLPLNDGIKVSDFLLSWSREEYENIPFDLVLSMYGNEIEEEPSGRFFCDRAWNFDHECIEANGDYIAIVRQFHRITGREKELDQLSDRVNWETKQASLQYTIEGVRRDFEIEMNDDWVDPKIAQIVIDDFRGDGFAFYGKDNGQATVWFYMAPENALCLNLLAGNVFGIKKKRWWKIWK